MCQVQLASEVGTKPLGKYTAKGPTVVPSESLTGCICTTSGRASRFLLTIACRPAIASAESKLGEMPAGVSRCCAASVTRAAPKPCSEPHDSLPRHHKIGDVYQSHLHCLFFLKTCFSSGNLAARSTNFHQCTLFFCAIQQGLPFVNAARRTALSTTSV